MAPRQWAPQSFLTASQVHVIFLWENVPISVYLSQSSFESQNMAGNHLHEMAEHLSQVRAELEQVWEAWTATMSRQWPDPWFLC